MKKYIFTALLLSQIVFSQQLPVEQVIGNFNKNQVEWAMPLPQNKQIQILWQERKTSFSSEGIRTFSGYIDQQFVGVISIYKNELSGNVSWEGKSYILSTQKGRISIKEDKNEGTCGVCDGTHCSSSHHHHDDEIQTQKWTYHPKNQSIKTPKLSALNIDPNQIDNIPEIYTDGVLRVYRLAILVDYSLYSNLRLDENRVKQFWAQTESFLNELYTRDLSIRFEIVKDDKLIRKSIREQVFPVSTTPNTITDESTKKINEIIGEKSYDVGVVASYGGTGLNGIAAPYWAYTASGKAGAWVSVLNPPTVAHELGHLFGSQHTFSEGGVETMNTEPGRGQSVMSYSRTLPRDFFSLPSIHDIRRAIQNNADYYTDEARSQRIGPQNSGNIVYGIPMQNRPPIIDRSKLKSEYILPQRTYFQFNIPAKDPDGHSILYTAHQANVLRRQRGGLAIVRSAKPQSDPTVVFYPQYYINDNQNVALVEHSAPTFSVSADERIFWLGASDAGALAQNPDHAVRYDMFPTKVKFVNGRAFEIISGIKKEHHAGEKITLTWGVDRNIFGNNSKVKISMSDDFGQSWKYVLVPETDNDGTEQISIPHIELGRKQHAAGISSGLGLIKIEVIDHIAVAISHHHPYNGGFEIKKSDISFGNLPPQFISVKEGQVPEKADLTATTTCTSSTNPLSVQFNETKANNLITRTWTANDTCGNTATFTQYIEVKKNVEPLRFVGELPKDIHIACPKYAVENPAELRVEGGTKPEIRFTQTKLEGSNDNYTLKRTWIATDADAEPIMHTQIVVVNDGVKPILSEYPKDMTVRSIADLPQHPTITATDNCDGNLDVEMTAYSDTVDGKQVYVYSWTATDRSGNQTRHQQRVTIDPNYVAPPTTPPLAWAVSYLPDLQVSCQSKIPSAQNPKTTGGKGKITITHQDTTPDNYCNTTIIRTYTAKDEEGQTITLTQNIKVEDNIAPTWNITNLPSDRTINHDDPIPSQMELTASDNCGTTTVIKSERKENGKVIYTWIAKDICGNEITHQQVIAIKPKLVQPIAPITWTSQLPQNVRVSCSGNIPNAESLTATGGEGTINITHTDIRSSETCANKYVIIRTYTATDGVRNIQHEQKIEVNDDITPSFVGDLPQNITIEEGQNIPAQAVLTATDNCSIANVETSEREVIENGKLKQKIYTWIAKDSCGNQTQHEQVIEIKEKKVEVPSQSEKPKLYPNPTNDNFQLSIGNVKGVKVYNTAGRLVKTFEPQQKYDISNLTAEVYIIAVETENETEFIKLIKR